MNDKDPAALLAEKILSIADVRIDLLKKGVFDACATEIRAYGTQIIDNLALDDDPIIQKAKSEGFALALEMACEKVLSSGIVDGHYGLVADIRGLEMPEEK